MATDFELQNGRTIETPEVPRSFGARIAEMKRAAGSDGQSSSRLWFGAPSGFDKQKTSAVVENVSPSVAVIENAIGRFRATTGAAGTRPTRSERAQADKTNLVPPIVSIPRQTSHRMAVPAPANRVIEKSTRSEVVAALAALTADATPGARLETSAARSAEAKKDAPAMPPRVSHETSAPPPQQRTQVALPTGPLAPPHAFRSTVTAGSAPEVAGPAANLLQAAADDPSLHAATMGNSAHMRLATPGGENVSLHLLVRDGVADIRVETRPENGQAATLDMRVQDLRTALAGEGISLGKFESSSVPALPTTGRESGSPSATPSGQLPTSTSNGSETPSASANNTQATQSGSGVAGGGMGAGRGGGGNQSSSSPEGWVDRDGGSSRAPGSGASNGPSNSDNSGNSGNASANGRGLHVTA